MQNVLTHTHSCWETSLFPFLYHEICLVKMFSVCVFPLKRIPWSRFWLDRDIPESSTKGKRDNTFLSLHLGFTLYTLKALSVKDSKVTRMLNVSCLKYFAKYKHIPCKCCTTSLWHPELIVSNIPCMLVFVAWGRGNSVRKNCLNCVMNHKSRKGMKISPAP